MKNIMTARNKFWNPIKHFYKHDRKTARDDEGIMEGFSDIHNDAVLFGGWHDYMLVVEKLPIEAQVFQAWWFATNEDRVRPGVDMTSWREVFPRIQDCDRAEQKRRLKRATEKYRKNKKLLSDPRTETGHLVPRVPYDPEFRTNS
jgi:hypothetical protein